MERIINYSFIDRKSHVKQLEKVGYSITDQARNYSEWLEGLCEVKARLSVRINGNIYRKSSINLVLFYNI